MSAWPVGTPEHHEYVPDATLTPAGSAAVVPHTHPFGIMLTPGWAGLSRAVPHINNVEYVRWLDRAAELHADSLGMTRATLAAGGHMWFVARHEVDYRGEAFPGERLHIFTWVRTMGRSTSWRDTAIVRAGSGALVCTATTCWALVDLASRKPTRIPAEMGARFQPLEAVRCISRLS